MSVYGCSPVACILLHVSTIAASLGVNMLFLKRLFFLLQCPPASEEHEALTSHNGVRSELTAGFLVHLDLDTSTPDTYQPPPAPLPYDVVFGCRGSTDSGSSREEEAISCSSFKTSAACVELEESDCKAHGNSLDVLPKMLELSKPCELNVLPKEEEDDCPICLEGT